MKKVPCSGPGCQQYRVHWMHPETARGVQYVEVADDFPDDGQAFCSMTCAILGGYMKLTCHNPCPKCNAKGIFVEHHGNYKCWQPEVDE